MLSDAEVILGIERQLMSPIFFLRVREMDGSVNLNLSSVDFPVHSRHTLRDEGVPEIFSTEFNKVFRGRGIVKVSPDSEIPYSGVVVEVVPAGRSHSVHNVGFCRTGSHYHPVAVVGESGVGE